MFRTFVIIIGATFGGSLGWLFGAGAVGILVSGPTKTAMTDAQVAAAEPWMTIAGILGAVIGLCWAVRASTEWYDRWVRWP